MKLRDIEATKWAIGGVEFPSEFRAEFRVQLDGRSTVKRKLCSAVLFLAATASPGFGQYTFSTLASFNGTNGQFPNVGLILSGSTLYGTTLVGGANGDGEVFSLPTSGGTPTVLMSADNINVGNPNTLVLSGTTLYGASSAGGQNYAGEVFSLPVSGGAPTVLTSLNNYYYEDNDPSLIVSGTTLYGTTTHSGGTSGYGEIFSLPLSGGTPTVVASFDDTNGFAPQGGLVLSGGMLYGTTPNGGAHNAGLVFSASVSGGTPAILASFDQSVNGGSAVPTGLILSGNTLYGAEGGGGVNGDGDIFSIPVSGGTPTVLASFDGTDGAGVDGGLILSGGTLYGTTVKGGANNDGVVFSLPITGGTPTVLASFEDTNGSQPETNLIIDASGNLYGTTTRGGTFEDGTVFELSPVPEPMNIGLFAVPILVGRSTRRRRL